MGGFEVSGLILQVAKEVQAKLDILYAQQGVPTMPGSPLDQAGLRDGFEIVDDYIRHGEYGVALEHLLYMIRAPGIAVSVDSMTALKSAAALMGMSDVALGLCAEQ